MIRLADEVSVALACGQAVVALESTIVAHGLPHPDNLALARELEALVRAGGAVPATVAVLDGELRVGLDDDALAQLAEQGPAHGKVGAGDLALAMGLSRPAATTVSATCLACARVGIRVFATGGIGGVHRGDSLDMSHDLEALARYPVCVVSAGAKSVLDLPRTLERLETLGVPVLGYQTDRFPAFYARDSGLPLEFRADDPVTVARVLAARWRDLELGGVLLANPVPADAAIEASTAGAWVEEGLADVAARGITGKGITPALLACIAERSGGRAVAANLALARSNAALAARVAVAWTELERSWTE